MYIANCLLPISCCLSPIACCCGVCIVDLLRLLAALCLLCFACCALLAVLCLLCFACGGSLAVLCLLCFACLLAGWLACRVVCCAPYATVKHPYASVCIRMHLHASECIPHTSVCTHRHPYASIAHPYGNIWRICCENKTKSPKSVQIATLELRSVAKHRYEPDPA